MGRSLAVGALLLSAAVLISPGASATTVPGQLYVVKTVVDDKGVHIPKDRFTRNGVTRYPRGAVIRYEFVNRGTRTYAVHIWFFKTDPIKRGGHGSQLIDWNYRGEYRYARLEGSKQVSPVGTIVVF